MAVVFAPLLVSCGGSAAGVRSAAAPVPAQVSARRTLFCRSTVTSHDIHGCVGEVTPAEYARRENTFLLHFDEGRLTKLEERRGTGRLEEHPGFCATDLFNYEGARLANSVCLDSHGQPESGLRYDRDGVRVYWLDGQGRPKPNDAGAAGLLRELDEHGWVVGYKYIDVDGMPTRGAGGVFHVRRKRDASGALTEDSYFDAQERPLRGPSGGHIVRYVLDANTDEISIRYFDREGRPTLGNAGFHERQYARDDVGNLLEARSYDTEGRPTVATDEGAAGWRIERDLHGNETRRSYFGADMRPIVGRYGYVTRTIDYDALGRKIRWSHFDAQDRPLERREGHSVMEVSYDDHDRTNAENFFDAKGHSVVTRSGYARRTYEYDERGDVSLERFFDDKGKSGGLGKTAAIRYEYERPHQRKSTTYLDESGQPTDGNVGFARIETRRDGKGEVVGKEYFDASGTRVDALSFRYILVRFSSVAGAPSRVTRTRAEAQLRAEEALHRIRAGTDFAAVQEQCCDDSYEYGPLWAEGGAVHVTPARLMPELLQPLVALSDQNISEIVGTPIGFWILKRMR